MGGIALLSLFGVGILLSMIGGDDDAPVEEPEVDPEGELLTLDGQATITGGEGDDTLIANFDDPNAFSAQVVNMGGGDDEVVFDIPSEATINGEAGNDTISSSGHYNTLDGGAGDDVLNGGPADHLIGGEGNDTLSVGLGTIYDGSGTLEGGEGEDTFLVATDIGYGKSDFPGATIVGGEAADTINLSLFLTYEDYNGPPASPDTATNTNAGILLSDFDRAEDSLVIQIDRPPEGADREMTSAEIETTTYTYQGQTYSYTDLVLSFAATDTYGAHTASIRLGEDVDLTVEDIVFIQN